MSETYILYSEKLNKYYVGSCIIIDKGQYEYKIGHFNYTQTGMTWKLASTKKFDSLIEAKQFETKIKKQKSKKYIELLINKKE